MSMMLKGLMAIKGPRPIAAIKKDRELMNRAQCRLHCQTQLSTVVKMCVEGYSHHDIVFLTGVSTSFVSTTKVLFDLVRPSFDEDVVIIRRVVMTSPDFKYKVSSLSKLTGIRKERIRKIIEKTPQIERGTTEGIIYHYRYNFDIKIGDGAVSRGIVG